MVMVMVNYAKRDSAAIVLVFKPALFVTSGL